MLTLAETTKTTYTIHHMIREVVTFAHNVWKTCPAINLLDYIGPTRIGQKLSCTKLEIMKLIKIYLKNKKACQILTFHI